MINSELKEILTQSRRVAIVGISDRQDRPSYGVSEYLEKHYEIFPVNPNLNFWKTYKCFPSLLDIPVSIDIVDIFRRSSNVLPVVEDAIKVGAKYIWMQQGIINNEAKMLAESHGLKVVMDSCIAVVHRQINFL